MLVARQSLSVFPLPMLVQLKSRLVSLMKKCCFSRIYFQPDTRLQRTATFNQEIRWRSGVVGQWASSRLRAPTCSERNVLSQLIMYPRDCDWHAKKEKPRPSTSTRRKCTTHYSR